MRPQGRSCGALPWTTTVSLSLPRSNSPIRKEERLAIKLRTERCPKNALWTSELRKSFKEGFGSTRNAERKGRTPTLDPLCQLAPAVNGWGFFRRWQRRTNLWRRRTNVSPRTRSVQKIIQGYSTSGAVHSSALVKKLKTVRR